jgi:hypothetical protein
MRIWRFSRLGGSTFASNCNAAASDMCARIPVKPAITQAQDELAERGLFEDQKVSEEQVATLQQQIDQWQLLLEKIA